MKPYLFAALSGLLACAHVGQPAAPVESYAFSLPEAGRERVETKATCAAISPEAEPVVLPRAGDLDLNDLLVCRVPEPRPALPPGWAYDGLFVAPQSQGRRNWVEEYSAYFGLYLERFPGCFRPDLDAPKNLFVFDSGATDENGALMDSTGHAAVVGSVAGKLACPEGAGCGSSIFFELLLAGGSRVRGAASSASHGTFLDFLFALAARLDDMRVGDVANFSVGFEDDGGVGPRAVRRAMDALTARGVQVVAAAGNRRGLFGPEAGLLGPASFSSVLAVEALDPRGNPLATRRKAADVLGMPGFGVPVIRLSAARLPDIDPQEDALLAGSSIASAVAAGLLARGVSEVQLRSAVQGGALSRCLEETYRNLPTPSVTLSSEKSVELDRAPSGFWLPAGTAPSALEKQWLESGEAVRPVGEGLIPQPLDPTCRFCQIGLQTPPNGFTFYIEANLPQPAPSEYWLRLVDASGGESYVDVSAQADASAQAQGEGLAVTYQSPQGGVSAAVGASLITVYQDPVTQGLFTFEEPVLVGP